MISSPTIGSACGNYRLFDSHVAELMNQALFHAEHVSMGAAENHDDLEASEVVTS